jgi:hypothetical protein
MLFTFKNVNIIIHRYAERSSRIQAVVNWFGPTNFLEMDPYLKASGVSNPMAHSVPGSPESLLIGQEKVSIELFPATGHGGRAFGTEENLERVFRFLDRYLKD